MSARASRAGLSPERRAIRRSLRWLLASAASMVLIDLTLAISFARQSRLALCWAWAAIAVGNVVNATLIGRCLAIEFESAPSGDEDPPDTYRTSGTMGGRS